MALHSKQDFAAMCGLTTGNLSNYEKRRKVVYSGDYIDDSLELNRLFLEKRQKKQPQPVLTEDNFLPPPNTPVVKPAQTRPPRQPRVTSTPREKGGLLAQDAEKMRLQNEKLQLSNDFMRRKLDKVLGETIPTDLAKAIISQLGRTYPTEYNNLWRQTLSDIAKRYGMSLEDEAKYVGAGIEAINKASTRAISEARREMRNVIQLFSDKKEVGEREL